MKLLKVLWIVACIAVHLNAIIPWLYSKKINTNESGIHLDIWRQFGKTDGRYLKADNLVISLEGMMVFVDLPLCIFWLLFVLAESPKQYIWQMITSSFHIFGTCMYWMGAYLRNFSDISSDPTAFWGTFVGGNGVWFVIPLLLILISGIKLTPVEVVTAVPLKKKVE